MTLPRAGVLLIGFGGAVAVALVGWIGARTIGLNVLRAGWAIPACVAIHAAQLWLSAVAWRRVSGGGTPRLRSWFVIRWIRELVNSLLPVAQLGGTLVGVRLLALRGRAAGPATAAATLDISIESVTQLLFTLAGMAALVAISGRGAWHPWIGGAVLLMACASCGFLLAQRAGLLRLLEALLARVRRLFPALPAGMLHGLHAELMRRQRDPVALAGAAALHLLAWALGVAETWLALLAMGARTGALAALVIESLGMAARSAGFAVPGALGVQEGGFVLAGGLVGLPPDAAMALSMVKRARELLVGIPGLLAWQWSEGRDLLRRCRPGRAGALLSGSGDQNSASKIVFGLAFTTGVSPVSGLRPRAAFSRRRAASFCGSTTTPGGAGVLPEHQPVGERRCRSPPAPPRHRPRGGCRPERAARRRRSALPGRDCRRRRPGGCVSAVCGTSAASAAGRGVCSCGRGAPGAGGRSVKSGGIDSGGCVVTTNSSGASRVRPKFRCSSSPRAGGEHKGAAGQAEKGKTRITHGGGS